LKTYRNILWIADFLLSYFAWITFFIYRKTSIEFEPLRFTFREYFVLSCAMSVCWVGFYALVGLYKSPHRRSRLKDLIILFQTTLFGVIVIFFVTLVDDRIKDYKDFQTMVLTYFAIQFGALGFVRLVLTTLLKKRIASGKITFPTLLVGGGKRAFDIWTEITQLNFLGMCVKGYVDTSEDETLFVGKLKHFGTLERLKEVIKSRKIEEIIIALDSNSRELFLQILRSCEGLKVHINVAPDMYDFLVGNVKLSNVLGAPLIEIYPHIIAPWEAVVKRLIDIIFSLFVLVIGFPFYLIIGILIKIDSKGSIFYKQERIGKDGVPFYIYKFRSMRVDAEQNIPMLSSDNDPRITRLGRFIRKVRVDEFPQFYNVLIGNMSLVGPRPERNYFIEQIVKVAPEYLHLLKVQPGITSWGMVKYGYAENIEQMIERLKFDLLYLENMSLLLDLKILVYTILTVLEGKGK